jgi:hypothetical protein
LAKKALHAKPKIKLTLTLLRRTRAAASDGRAWRGHLTLRGIVFRENNPFALSLIAKELRRWHHHCDLPIR